MCRATSCVHGLATTPVTDFKLCLDCRAPLPADKLDFLHEMTSRTMQGAQHRAAMALKEARALFSGWAGMRAKVKRDNAARLERNADKAERRRLAAARAARAAGGWTRVGGDEPVSDNEALVPVPVTLKSVAAITRFDALHLHAEVVDIFDKPDMRRRMELRGPEDFTISCFLWHKTDLAEAGDFCGAVSALALAMALQPMLQLGDSMYAERGLLRWQLGECQDKLIQCGAIRLHLGPVWRHVDCAT